MTDYIAGMTDNYILLQYAKIGWMQKIPHEFGSAEDKTRVCPTSRSFFAEVGSLRISNLNCPIESHKLAGLERWNPTSRENERYVGQPCSVAEGEKLKVDDLFGASVPVKR